MFNFYHLWSWCDINNITCNIDLSLRYKILAILWPCRYVLGGRGAVRMRTERVKTYMITKPEQKEKIRHTNGTGNVHLGHVRLSTYKNITEHQSASWSEREIDSAAIIQATQYCSRLTHWWLSQPHNILFNTTTPTMSAALAVTSRKMSVSTINPSLIVRPVIVPTNPSIAARTVHLATIIADAVPRSTAVDDRACISGPMMTAYLASFKLRV